MQIAPSTCHQHAARQANPAKRPARAQRDDVLCARIRRAWEENFEVYGVRKLWRELPRQQVDVARCTVECLMRRLEIRSVIRGKVLKTKVSDRA